MKPAPDVPSAVKAALAEEGVAPLKRFGQNFLVDRRALDRAADAARVGPDDVVLEPGPGLGALTVRLLATGARVIAAEIDRGLVARLRREYGGESRLVIVEGDVLKAGEIAPAVLAALPSDVGSPPKTPWRVATNLPYGITGPFLTALLKLPGGPPPRIAAMLQREAVDALLASPGDEEYSVLSLAARLYWKAEKLFTLGPDAFYPRPEIDSCVVALERIDGAAPSPRAFLPFARGLFQSRRKALRTTLKRTTSNSAEALDAAFSAADLKGDERVDGVAPEKIAALFASLPPENVPDAGPGVRW